MAALAAAPAVSVAAPATQADPARASTPCFRLSDLGGHKIASSDSLYYSVRRKEVYKFTFSGSCLAGVTNSDVAPTDAESSFSVVVRLSAHSPDSLCAHWLVMP